MLSLHFAPTTDEPYAWDYPSHDGQFPSEPLDELGCISVLLKANFLLTTIIGGLLSFTLFYLVCFKTTGALKNYRKMLFICSVNDVTYWAFDNLMGTKLKEKDGVFMVKLEGPIRFLEREPRLRIFSVYIFSACLVNSLLPAQVYFRYCSLLRSQPLSTAKTTILFLISFLAAAPNCYLAYLGYGSSAEVRPGYNYGKLWYREVPLPPVFYADIRSTKQKIYFIYGGCFVCMSYGVSVFFGYKTMQKMSTLYDSCSENTKRLQRQLNSYLFVQFIIPLVVCVGPMMYFVIPAFFYVDTGRPCLLIGVSLSWIPMLNALITMIVIVPYRRFLMRMIFSVLPDMCKGATSIRDYKSRSTGSG
ncbi:unnamed protein product [Bursaphelenchus xylophilus]|uniref:(pine wood nematode) hypothetical protein n=1 Tax=Bursaphelenchus xylophilus TaxID=6326 RepID=A0A1I7RJQ1_BURXY|nr:unnamed protein product [Bursaphelenchus xylophilus]CAG9128983.1 unnamed protein product [Bursaphelenchus xylophilus]